MHTVKEFRKIDGRMVPYVEVNGVLVPTEWAPMPGSQELFLKSTAIYEVLYAGTRAGGKSECLLVDFAQGVGQGYGTNWRGLVLRQTHPQLGEIIHLSQNLFPRLFPGACSFNKMLSTWDFADGASLSFSHLADPSQYNDYHGHAYPWIGWEELTTWPNDECFKVMFSVSRSVHEGIPKRVRSTTNPYNQGHQWVRDRYRLPLLPGQIKGPIIFATDDKGNPEPPRMVICGSLTENLLLTINDPGYIERLRSSARNESELASWLEGSWDIAAGGILDDIWSAGKSDIIVENFTVPADWKIMRAYDHGSSRPFVCQWYAQSNGEDLTFDGGRVTSTLKGDLYLCGEYYGSSGKPNEGLRMAPADIAKGILEHEAARGWTKRVKWAVADSSIFDASDSRPSIASDFEKAGVRWTPADKGPGSRVQGLTQLRTRLKGAIRRPGIPRETPGLFIVGDQAPNWLRTVPVMARDNKNFEDARNDEITEDHSYDCCRYALRFTGELVPSFRSRRIPRGN